MISTSSLKEIVYHLYTVHTYFELYVDRKVPIKYIFKFFLAISNTNELDDVNCR